MGVQRLNQYLRASGGKNVRLIQFKDLKGRRIAVDASIYMYRFLGDRCLLAGMYQMVMLFRKHDAELVFVFDGRPPPEKRESQEERRRKKEAAYQAHKELEAQIQNQTSPVSREMRAELSSLRKKSLRLGKKKIEEVRTLLSLCGCEQIIADGEADSICARLVRRGECWACLSEDTDMFPFDCSRVLRCMSLVKESCVLYDWDHIRADIGIPQNEFQLVCAAAGSDYGSGLKKLDIDDAMYIWKLWVNKGRITSLSDELMGECGDAIDEAVEGFRVTTPFTRIPCEDPNLHGVREYLGQYGFVFVM